MNDKIKALISTLNSIDVRGKDNLDKMLGCILTLEQMITEDEEEITDGR